MPDPGRSSSAASGIVERDYALWLASLGSRARRFDWDLPSHQIDDEELAPYSGVRRSGSHRTERRELVKLSGSF